MGDTNSTGVKTHRIYVRLLDEGTEVCRPTEAEELGGMVFRLLPTDNYDPEDETWEFLPGSVVRCEKQVRSEGVIVVACTLVEE